MKNRLKKVVLLNFILLFTILFSKADEGLWLPLLLEKYTIQDMQSKGFRLTAEDIYSVNHASMKDAIVRFGRGCTGELISGQSLLITNHHCGLSQIQTHSTVEHNYLEKGFYAMSKQEELSCPNLKVTFLVKMEDVTAAVLKAIPQGANEIQREQIVDSVIQVIKKEAVTGNHYTAEVAPFYYGNEFYLFLYEVFTDVRLVCAPPESIGSFGGDTDNWMWPRHTGDFCLFRIYADTNNRPADYSPHNVPYQPKKFFPISLKGVKESDFTFIFGYPGQTTEYLTSYAVALKMQVANRHSILLRDARLNVIRREMEKSEKVHIQYVSKYAGISNAWKKWIGENRGLQKINAVGIKQEEEQRFTQWAGSDKNNNAKYTKILPVYKTIYEKLTPYQLVYCYLTDGIFSIELMKAAGYFNKLAGDLSRKEMKSEATNTEKTMRNFFKDYYSPIDKEICANILKMYHDNVPEEFHPPVFSIIKNSFQNDFQLYTDYVFSNSIIVNEDKVYDFLWTFNRKSRKQLLKDPAYLLFAEFSTLFHTKIWNTLGGLENQLNILNRSYMQGLREMDKDRRFYPDANSTLRIAYGKVDGYFPSDGVYYRYFTTLEGLLEKESMNVYDYKVPEKLRQLYANKDFGQYAENGEMHVNFIASNHTTGGNSGSPVINADGQLIGVNFDRCWEGTMSDIMYDPDQCRNIALDIRYALFIIDKFAGASYLLNEMTLVYE